MRKLFRESSSPLLCVTLEHRAARRELDLPKRLSGLMAAAAVGRGGQQRRRAAERVRERKRDCCVEHKTLRDGWSTTQLRDESRRPSQTLAESVEPVQFSSWSNFFRPDRPPPPPPLLHSPTPPPLMMMMIIVVVANMTRADCLCSWRARPDKRASEGSSATTPSRAGLKKRDNGE